MEQNPKKRIAIVGSRQHPNLQMVIDFINTLPLDVMVVSGGARGVDITAENWAKARGINTLIFKSEYDKYPSNVAPLIRNQTIVDNSDYMVAFPYGKASGTYDAITKAKIKGIPIKIFEYINQ